MGRVDKGVKCSIIGCEKRAVRSISVEKVKSAGLNVRSAKRAYLCKNHYKELKRKLKKEEMVKRWRWRL